MLKRVRGGSWVRLEVQAVGSPCRQAVWLRLGWITRMVIRNRDRLSAHGQTVPCDYGVIRYAAPGCEPEEYDVEGDDLAVLTEYFQERQAA